MVRILTNSHFEVAENTNFWKKTPKRRKSFGRGWFNPGQL